LLTAAGADPARSSPKVLYRGRVRLKLLARLYPRRLDRWPGRVGAAGPLPPGKADGFCPSNSRMVTAK